MKTFSTKLACLFMLAALTFAPLTAQDNTEISFDQDNSDYLFGYVYVEDLKSDLDLYTLDDKTITVDYLEAEEYEYTVQEVLAAYMLAFGVGLGFGEDNTLYCLHANVFMRLAMFTTSALYVGAGLFYDGISNDFFTQSLLGVTGYLMMFTALTKYREVFLLYGLKALLGFGKQDIEDSIEYDLDEFSISAIIGFMFILSPAWSLALYTPLITHITSKLTYDGDEIKNNSTFFNINKNAVFILSLVYRFGSMRNQEVADR